MKRAAGVAILVTTVAAGAAFRSEGGTAHLDLRKAVPEPYESVDTVSAIRLWFTEVPSPGTTVVRVVGDGDAPVRTGKPAEDPRDPRAFVVALGRTLPPGAYTVSWEATGTDGHGANGYFPFSVRAPK